MPSLKPRSGSTISDTSSKDKKKNVRMLDKSQTKTKKFSKAIIMEESPSQEIKNIKDEEEEEEEEPAEDKKYSSASEQNNTPPTPPKTSFNWEISKTAVRKNTKTTDYLENRKNTIDYEEENDAVDYKDVRNAIVPEPKHSKTLSEQSTKYDKKLSKVIEELEAQKLLKSQKLKSMRQEENVLGDNLQERKIRFGDEEMSKSLASSYKGLRLEHSVCPKTCEQFLKIEDFSTLFVDSIIEEAVAKGNTIKKESSSKIIEGIEYRPDSEYSLSTIKSIGTYVCILEWPTINDFTIELGASKISEYVSFWKFEEDWKYCVNYIKGKSDEACDFFYYEAIFSIPCKQYPIPQATASVYFTMEVSRVRPKHCPVDVCYSFEGRRLKHTPGQFKIQEEWLFHIVDAKIAFFKSLHY